ncbi:hypothetical protein M0802_005162 [Mischocyttarus mexicanus]|nr:hypothetical protein M0802_005162 [Mischocyttarus mexicanus]
MSEAEDASGKTAANLTAVEAISAKLAEVTRLAEKLDAKLCEAGARTQPVPIPTSALPISSTLTSTTTTLARTTSPVALSKTTTPTTTSLITEPITETNPPTFVSTNSNFGLTSIGATDLSTLTVSNFGLSSGAIISHVEDTKTSSAVSSIPSGSFPSTMASSEAVSNTSSINDNAEKKQEIEDVEKFNEENTNEDVNVDGYVTATECSITPTARSRSESFVTSPECEDVIVTSVIPTTSSTLPWWKPEESTKEQEIIIPVDIEKSEESLKSFKMDEEKAGLVPIGKTVTIEKSTEEKSGKIVKEVTETTTLRVSHDTHLGVASYKVTSNTLQDHRHNVDIKKMQDSDHTVIEDEITKLNGIDRDIDATSAKDLSEPPKEESKKIPIYSTISKEIKMDEEKSDRISKETKTVCSITKTYTRHHEDSGIEMSPIKRDKDDLEGEEFLENSRKVSRSIDDIVQNSEKNISIDCCSCSCANEAACFALYDVSTSGISKFAEITAVALANENRRRLPLANPS